MGVERGLLAVSVLALDGFLAGDLSGEIGSIMRLRDFLQGRVRNDGR